MYLMLSSVICLQPIKLRDKVSGDSGKLQEIATTLSSVIFWQLSKFRQRVSNPWGILAAMAMIPPSVRHVFATPKDRCNDRSVTGSAAAMAAAPASPTFDMEPSRLSFCNEAGRHLHNASTPVSVTF